MTTLEYFNNYLFDNDVDKMLATGILCAFFVIGSFGNLFFIHIHLRNRSFKWINFLVNKLRKLKRRVLMPPLGSIVVISSEISASAAAVGGGGSFSAATENTTNPAGRNSIIRKSSCFSLPAYRMSTISNKSNNNYKQSNNNNNNNNNTNYSINNNRISSYMNRTNINNDAMFASSIANFILCMFYIPHTIMIRIWDFSLPNAPCKLLEHLKDSLLYFNYFMISIIAFERYIAICRANLYKNLEKRIAKIIWFVYFVSFMCSMANYFAILKCNQQDTGGKQAAVNNNHDGQVNNATGTTVATAANASNSSLLSSAGETLRQNLEKFLRLSNIESNLLNLWVSIFLFSLNGLVTISFYIGICVKYLSQMKSRKHNQIKTLRLIKNKVHKQPQHQLIVFQEQKQQEQQPADGLLNESDSFLVAQGDSNLSIKSAAAEDNKQQQATMMKRVSSFKSPPIGSKGLAVRSKSVPNICDETNVSKLKRSDAKKIIPPITNKTASLTQQQQQQSSSTSKTVTTKNLIAHKHKSIIKYKSRKSTITTVSIMLSVLTCASVVPFIFVSIKLIGHSRSLYFLFFTENVFNPIVYIFFQKHYRKYFLQIFKSKSSNDKS